MKTLILGATLVSSLSGCAALNTVAPDTIAPEFEHMSHALQHAPFAVIPTNYGTEIIQVTAEWDIGKHVYIALSEGVALGAPGMDGTHYGEIQGPREQFTGKIGYRFQVKR